MKPTYQKYALILISLFFYACGAPEYLVLFIGVLIFNLIIVYVLQWTVKKCVHRSAYGSRILLFLGISFNIGVLFYYKYYIFTITSINSIFQTSYETKKLLLPLGISFFTFKAISLLTDVYHAKYELKDVASIGLIKKPSLKEKELTVYSYPVPFFGSALRTFGGRLGMKEGELIQQYLVDGNYSLEPTVKGYYEPRKRQADIFLINDNYTEKEDKYTNYYLMFLGASCMIQI